MGDSDPQSLFGDARDRFVQVTLLLSGLSILGAGASRIPTWEVQAPVEWLAGSVNVGFLPVFGPILITAGYAYLYLAWRAVVVAARRLPSDARESTDPLGYGLVGPLDWKDRATAIALVGYRGWAFVVPIVALVILLATYFDFCAPPAKAGDTPPCTLSQRVLTLGFGTSGVTGFQPVLSSIQSNLNALADRTDKDEEKTRLRELAALVPWIYPPWQTWLYLACLGLTVYLAISAMRLERGQAP